MTAIATQPGKKQLENRALNAIGWAKITGNISKNAYKGRETVATADAANAALEYKSKILQRQPKTQTLWKYRVRLRPSI